MFIVQMKYYVDWFILISETDLHICLPEALLILEVSSFGFGVGRKHDSSSHSKNVHECHQQDQNECHWLDSERWMTDKNLLLMWAHCIMIICVMQQMDKYWLKYRVSTALIHEVILIHVH